ncbi:MULTISPECIES: hypothetical protein [Sphingobium]|uniref:hypothetical protein n=1 Tax=Sphingobium TaxID=165695 RepID=UPI00159C4507|nr:hypothetical protein [Sphingobium sp. 15-1]
MAIGFLPYLLRIAIDPNRYFQAACFIGIPLSEPMKDGRQLEPDFMNGEADIQSGRRGPGASAQGNAHAVISGGGE